MSPVRSVIEHIRRAVTPEGDGELLGRFVERRDERALAALVERHGPMVWGVCRRLLSHHDAEDAFQVTFIVLARKAGSMKPREMVGNWLYGVARQAALQVRTAKRREVQVTEMPEVEAPQDQWADVRPVLDEELSRLPEHYRAVIVLSDLEGKTRKEVAAQVGCPEGTVASRLARARALLAKRLTRRGVALSGGALAAVLSQYASAAVPTAVVMSTIKAANLGQIPVKVAALAEGVLKTMLLTKLKSVMAILVIAVVVGLAGYGLARGQQRAPQKQESEPKARKDAVVKEKAETTAWGEEVDGLQMGLEGAQNVQQGEKAKFAVKLRNVGKAEIAITYRLLRESPPQVTTADGGKVSVFMPAPFDGLAGPIKRAIKPRETITLYNPEVAVESEALMRLKGIMRVTTPTICVAPGKYKIAFGGMIQSHPKLATGTVEFEVKDEFAWGKAVDGLQAGVGPTRGTYRPGETVTMVIKLRNVGTAPVAYTYLLTPFQYVVPTVHDPAGNAVAVDRQADVFSVPATAKATLQPGEEVTLGPTGKELSKKSPGWYPMFALAPSAGGDMPVAHVGPGRHTVSYSGLVQSHPTLNTGNAGFEVEDKPEPFTAWGKEVGGLQGGLGYKSGEKRAYSHGETVTLVIRVRNVSKEAVKITYHRLFFADILPTVTDGDGKQVRISPFPRIYSRIMPESVDLAPGKEVELAELKLELRPVKGTDEVPGTLYGAGKVQVHYKQVSVASINPILSKLPTGKLELEVTEKK